VSAVHKKQGKQDKPESPEKPAPKKRGRAKGLPQFGGHTPQDYLFDDPANVEKLEHLAGLFLSIDHIAASFNVARLTFYRILDRRPHLREVMEQGKAKTLREVTNSVVDGAKTGDRALQMFLLKAKGNWKEQVEVAHTGSVKHEVSLEAVKRVERMSLEEQTNRLNELRALKALDEAIDVEFEDTTVNVEEA
jgi:hypothetical protein